MGSDTEPERESRRERQMNGERGGDREKGDRERGEREGEGGRGRERNGEREGGMGRESG